MNARVALVLSLVATLVPPPASAEIMAGATGQGPPRLAERDLFADPLWDDGRAEFTTYRGSIEREGARRSLEARLIVVKEDMHVAQRVKSESGPIPGATSPVLKLYYGQDFTTGASAWHQASTAFVDRASGLLHKLTVSSQDGCGLTFARLAASDGQLKRVLHSYWDGEGDREAVVECSGCASGRVVAADVLPLWLRRLDLTHAQAFRLEILPSQLSHRAQPLVLPQVGVEVVGRADRHGLLVRVGSNLQSDVVIEGASVDRYWFDPAWPHPLVRFEGGPDSVVLERVKTTRIAYWKETDPGDERLVWP